MLRFFKDNFKTIFTILSIVIVVPILLGLLLNIPFGKYTIGSEDSWVAFHGSYIGGVTGGLVAYFIAKMQINALKKEAASNHKRFYVATKREMDFLESQLPSIKDKLKYSFHSYHNIKHEITPKYTRENQLSDLRLNLELLTSLHSDLISTMKFFQSFSLSDVPPHIAEEFQSLIRSVSILDNQITQFTKHERALLSFLDTQFNFANVELSNQLDVYISDNKRIYMDVDTHVENYKKNVKAIDNYFLKDVNP